MSIPVIQPSFAAGELSPGLYGRVDLAKFHVGAALLRNFFVDARGGASNRPGTEFIVPCLSGTNRLIDFTFSTTQTYALLFSDLKLRFITNGGVLLEAAGNITAASKGKPCQITQVGHGYATNDWVYITAVVGMTRLNGRFFIITKVDNDNYTLADTNGVAIDSSAYAAYSSGGTGARIYTITSPYAAADLALLKYTQSADTMTLTHTGYQTRQLKRAGALSWSFSTVSTAATQGPPTGIGVAAAVGAAATGYRYVVTALTAAGLESAPCTAGAVLNAATMSTTAAEHITVTWVAPAGTAPVLYNVYRQLEIPGSVSDVADIYGFVGQSTGLTFVDHNITPDFTQTPPIVYDPFASSTWPGCSTYFQGRQVYAGASSQPETMNFSKTGDFANFSYSSPSRPNDGIVATIASRQVNAIKHMMPMQSLIALSASGAWRVDAGALGTAITPSAIQAVPQAFNGCSDVPPIAVNYDILYVQSKGSVVRDLAYNFYVNVYTGADMTVLSNHLFFGHQIVEWAWAEEPFKLVWAVRDDGVLLSFTYLKEQDVYAWTHHDCPNGLFKSVCSVSEGNENAVYFVVQRLINGTLVQYVERLASRNMAAKPEYNPPVPADLSKAWFVDCGLQYPLTKPVATATPLSTGAAASNIPGNPLIVYSIVGGDAIAGGSGYTAPTVIVTDALGTGTGAEVIANVVAGAITSYGVVLAGQNYQQPVFKIVDPTGTGAIGAPVLSNDVVVNFSGAVTATVGDMLRMNDGWGTVRVVNGATQVTVNVQYPFSGIWPAASGAWSLTTPITTFSGLDHLEGQAVSVLADGNVVSDGVNNALTVTNGAITLPQAASAVLAGLPYKAQFKSLYTDVPGQNPTVQGRRISINAVTLRVQDTRGLKVGHSFNDLTEMKERDFQPMGFPILPITGDERIIVGSQWEVDAQVCAEQGNPLPCTILALIPELQVGDSPG